MDVVAPTSWAEAGLDTATPRDRAPLQAIWSAIAERYAAARASSVGPLGDATTFRGCVPGQTQVLPQTFYSLVRAIRYLQSVFFNPSVPYSDFGWKNTESSTTRTVYPDVQTSRFMPPRGAAVRYPQDYGLFPYDALSLVPPGPHPAPGDSTAGAATRAFYAWCRQSLDRMTTIYVDGRHFHSDASWESIGTSYGSLSELVGHATRVASGGGHTPRAAGYYDAAGEIAWSEISVPADIRACNRSALAADMRLVASALDWPSGGWTTDSYVARTVFDPFGAPGCSSAPGLSETAVRAAPGAWVEIVPPSRSCPMPSASTPGVPDSDVPTDSGGRRYFSITCEYSALLDFSSTFHFHADVPAQS